MVFLPLNVVESIELKLRIGLKKHNIVKYALKKDVLELNDPISIWLNINMEKNLVKLFKGLYSGYEVDESDLYKELGLLEHPHLKQRISHDDYAGFTLCDGSFEGELKIPYYSRYDFVVPAVKGSDMSGMDNAKDLPIWFEELYISTLLKVFLRNEDLRIKNEIMFDRLYAKMSTGESKKTTEIAKEEILMGGCKYIPMLVHKVCDEDCEISMSLLDKIWGFKALFEEEENYLDIRKDKYIWKKYLIDWGKKNEWID